MVVADVAHEGAAMCAALRDEIERLGHPPTLASRIERTDAVAGLLLDGLTGLARDAREQVQEATAVAEVRVGAWNLVWFAHQLSRLTNDVARLRDAARDYHDRAFATMYGDADRNAVEAALDADGEGSAIAFDLDQLAHRG